MKCLEMKNLIQINIQYKDLNGNKQPVQLGYTYSSMELKSLKDKVYHDSHYKTLSAQICKKVINLKIYKEEGEDVELELKAETTKSKIC